MGRDWYVTVIFNRLQVDKMLCKRSGVDMPPFCCDKVGEMTLVHDHGV